MPRAIFTNLEEGNPPRFGKGTRKLKFLQLGDDLMCLLGRHARERPLATGKWPPDDLHAAVPVRPDENHVRTKEYRSKG